MLFTCFMKEYLIIYNTQDCVRVPSDDIIYIQADGNYSDIYLYSDKPQNVLMGIGDIGEEIENQLIDTCDSFVQVGRSLIINLNYLIHISLQKESIQLYNGTSGYYTVEVSKEPLKTLKEHVENLIVKKNNGPLKKLIRLMGKK